MQEIKHAIENMIWPETARPHDCVERALEYAGIPFERALETSCGMIDFLVASEVVVQVETPPARGSESFRQLGTLLENLGYREGVLLSARHREAFETEWHTRQAKSLPVQILPLRLRN